MILSQKNPSALSGLIGNPEALAAARKWAEGWQSGKKQKPLLAYGPVGVGKTALAHALASEFSWQLFEFNASELRDSDSVERILAAAASSSSLFGSRKLILIDDVDALSGKDDRGGIAAIAKVLSSPPQPILLTAHNLYDRKIQSIRNYCDPVQFRRVHAASVAKLVRERAAEHGIALAPELLEKIAAGSAGDVRAALNDLQGKNPNAFRDSEKGIFEVLSAILKSESYSEARNAAFSSETDHDALKIWMAHSMPLEYEKPFDVATAYDALSRADIFDGRIHRNQYYGYLRYSNDLLSAGVALAKAAKYRKYVSYGFPDYLREMGATKGSRATRKAVLQKVSHFCHCSPSQAQGYLPLLELLVKKRPQETAELLNLDGDELAFVSKTKPKAEKKEGAAKEKKEGKKKKGGAKKKGRKKKGEIALL